MNSKKIKQVFTGLGFISPNICGFLIFTLVPLVFSMILAFTNWDLKLHNMFKPENHIQFVGFANFVRLFKDEYFLMYFGNTLFFMMGIPFGIAGSLGAAILLNNNFKGVNNKVWKLVIVSAIMAASLCVLVAIGMKTTALTILVISIGGLMLVGGTVGGSTVYRTLFFLPHFTSGVAVFLLWKKMYSPIGPINSALAKPLNNLSAQVNSMEPSTVQIGFWLLFALFMLILVWRFKVLNMKWREAEIDSFSVILPTLFTCIPAYFFSKISPVESIKWVPLAIAAVLLLACIVNWIIKKQDFDSTPWKGHGGMIVGSLIFMVAQFICIGLSLVIYNLPEMAVNGLEAPLWIADYYWAKPAIMIMSLWGSIGSNNMLLYLAGLSNVPPELYEAADIDGASGFQRFSSITWPQLAPVTFFIFIMSVMGGLQGGFATARTMTQGGPAGATTTLSYYIYTEGFNTGRLGYASAIGWGLFALVFSITIFNWKFGSKYVNE